MKDATVYIPVDAGFDYDHHFRLMFVSSSVRRVVALIVRGREVRIGLML
jgi:hypothetical protein